MGKPRSKVSAAEVVARKKKKAKRSDLSSNPFEVRVNRRKHDVLGQNIRSGRGLPGVARSRAVQKRKQTLLQEYRSRGKAGVFQDKRFGEYDSQLSVEEKLAQRFFLEKKKRHGKFSLEDDDNEEGLTHFGQSLGDMEKFDDIRLSDGEEEEDISQTHFGGFLKRKRTATEGEEGQESETPKSRKDIMRELVAKSKQMKYERQSVKREAGELMETLDSQWEDVRGLISQPKAPPPRAVGSTDSTRASGGSDYDRVVRELAFERKAQATDRLKTTEELARDERDRLMKLEADRVQRMRGEERIQEGVMGVNHTSADAIITRSRKKKEVRFMIRYEDGVLVEPHMEMGEEEEGEREEGEEEEGEREEGEEEEGRDDELEGEEVEFVSDDEEEEEEEEGSGDPAEEFGSDLESEEDNDEGNEGGSKEGGEETSEEDHEGGVEGIDSPAKLSEMRKEAMKELPYTFKMPTSLLDLLAHTTGRSGEECGTVVERIHSCHHPSLAPENRKLLEKFLDLVVSYCRHLGREATQQDLQTLSYLASPMLALAQVSPLHTARLFRRLVSTVHKSWKSARRRLFPPFDHVVIFWLVGVVFPTSDFRHPVTTPAMLIMGQILLKSSVKTVGDLVLGLTVCHIFTTLFISSSRRLVPELVNFLTSCTSLISTHPTPVVLPPFSASSKLRSALRDSVRKWQPTSPLPDISSVLSLIMAERVRGGEDGEIGGDPAVSAAAISSCLRTVQRLTQLYRDLPSFAEVFSAIAFNLQHVSPTLPPPIQELVGQVLESVSHSAPRPVLQLLKKKPKSIKFYEPSFDAVYDIRKRRAPNKPANERQKLRHKVKMERKGAIRELKKDAHFLSREKIREAREKDAEREKKTRQIVHDLQSMQHEAKMERLTHRRKR